MTAGQSQRLPALDWLRGLVMAVMAVDHADHLFNPDHAARDASWMWPPYPLPTWDFLTRWCTHLCAPTFLFLAGASMALSVARAEAAGQSRRAIDRHWLLRGAVLIAVDATWMSAIWRSGQPGLGVGLGVLYALGGGLMLMVLLRRLQPWLLLAVALLLPLLVEVLYQPPRGIDSAPLPLGLLISCGTYRGQLLAVLYPLLPWFSAMLLGWLFARRLAAGMNVARELALWGALALVAFTVLRAINGIGNLGLLRRDGSLVEWLHCSKYPPSATFLLMELGLMALLLAALLVLQKRPGAGSWRNNPLLVIGQVPLFFYLLHLPVLGVGQMLEVFAKTSPWWKSWLIAAVVVALLYPLCGLYRWYKQHRRHAWTRYL